MSPKTTQDTHVLLVPCAEMTHVQLNMHVRTTQALDNMRVPRVEFRDIRLTRECMWFQHVLFCSAITQTGTSQTTQTLQTQAPVQLSAPSTPQSTPFLPPPDATSPPVGSGLELGAIVAIVIIVLIVIVLGVLILVFILTLAWKRMSRKVVKSLDNPEYSLTGNVRDHALSNKHLCGLVIYILLAT